MKRRSTQYLRAQCLFLSIALGFAHLAVADPAGPVQHMHNRVRKLEALLSIPQVRKGADPDEVTTVSKAAEAADKALRAGHYAKAWSALNDARVFNIVSRQWRDHVPSHVWLVAGPFTNMAAGADVEADALNRDVIIGKRYSSRGVGDTNGVCAWTELNTRFSQAADVQGVNILDVERAVDLLKGGCTYAYTLVQSPEPAEVVWTLNTEDEIAVWLNGNRMNLLNRPDRRSITLALRRGWNSLVIRGTDDDVPGNRKIAYQFAEKDGDVLLDATIDPYVISKTVDEGHWSLSIQGPVITSISWKGHELFRTHYLIFSGTARASQRGFYGFLNRHLQAGALSFAPAQLHRQPDGSSLLVWEGDVPSSGKLMAMRMEVEIHARRLDCRFRYEVREPLNPRYKPLMRGKPFDRETATYVYDRLFYWLLHSRSPWLWNTDVTVETSHGTTRKHMPPAEAEPGERLPVAHGLTKERIHVTYDTPEGPLRMTVAPRGSTPYNFTMQGEQRQGETLPRCAFGVSDRIFSRQDAVEAGYSNAVFVTFDMLEVP